MKIAVNTRLLLPGKLEGIGRFAHEILQRMCRNHPEDEFVFFFDRAYDERFIYGDNVTPVVIPPMARHPILFYYWFEFKIKRALNTYKPDVFLSPDGYLPLHTNVPMVPVIHDINFEHRPQDLPFSSRFYYRTFFRKFAHHATQIVTVSHYSKADISKTYGVNAEKIHVVYNGVSDRFSPIPDNEQANFKEEFSQGKDYFLFVGSLHPRKNIDRLIKAFDQFKQSTNSDKRLVLVGEKMWWTKELKAAYENSPYKADILLKGRVSDEQLPQVYATAFALVNVSLFEGFGIPLIEAMKSGTAVITSTVTSLPEVAGEAALIVNPEDIDAISTAMKTLDADDTLRNELVEKGKKQADKFDWDTAAEDLYQVLVASQKS